MRVAVLGAGIAGLSAAYFLLEKGFSVDIFDGKTSSASYIPSLLLHPFLGKKAPLSLFGKEAFEISSTLIAEVEHFLGDKVSQSGIFRLGEFQKRAAEEAAFSWCQKGDLGEGLWFERGKTVFSALFFLGLKALLKTKGAAIVEKWVEDLADLKSYDRIIVAAGYETLRFFPKLNLQLIKGQALLCRTDDTISFAISKDVHIVPTQDPGIVQVGSSYEHGAVSFLPDREKALLLLQKARAFYKPAEGFKVIDVFSSARLTRKGSYLPLVEEVEKHIWLFTAFGSRGMLYAPFFAKTLHL